MPSTKDIDTTARFFGIFKGSPGTGKTRAAGSFPAPYFFDFDGRLSILRTIFPDKDIQYDSYYKDFNGAMKKLEQLTNYCPYGTVVVDSLTSFARTILGHMIKYRGDSNKGQKQLLRGGLEVPQIEDYGGETAALVQLTDALRVISDKKVKIILIAHVVETESTNIKTQATVHTRQLLTGGKKIAAELPAYYDEAYHFYTLSDFNGKPEFHAITQNGGEDWAKTALLLPQDINWTNKDFYKELSSLVPGIDRVTTHNPITPKSNGGF